MNNDDVDVNSNVTYVQNCPIRRMSNMHTSPITHDDHHLTNKEMKTVSVVMSLLNKTNIKHLSIVS